MKKIFMSFALVSMIISCFSTNQSKVTAKGIYNGTIHYYTDEEIEEAAEKKLEEILASTAQPMNDEIIEVTQKVGEAISGWGAYKPCFNQLAGGHVFSTAGSGFYWGDSSQTTGSCSISVTIGGKNVSVSVGYQPGTKLDSSGIFEVCPSNLIGKNVKLYCRRQHKVIRYAVYRKNKYSTGNGTFSRYVDVAIPYSQQTLVALYDAYN